MRSGNAGTSVRHYALAAPAETARLLDQHRIMTIATLRPVVPENLIGGIVLCLR